MRGLYETTIWRIGRMSDYREWFKVLQVKHMKTKQTLEKLDRDIYLAFHEDELRKMSTHLQEAWRRGQSEFPVEIRREA